MSKEEVKHVALSKNPSDAYLRHAVNIESENHVVFKDHSVFPVMAKKGGLLDSGHGVENPRITKDVLRRSRLFLMTTLLRNHATKRLR